MKVLLFVNNRVGWQITSFLKKSGISIVGLVLHPKERRKYGDEIIEASGATPEQIIDGSLLNNIDILKRIEDMQPEMGVSVFFGYILRKNLLDKLSLGCINLHPALLPYNKGAHPNVWSIIDETPAGVTLHHIDEGVDTGDIIEQSEVLVEQSDTGESLYRKLESACVDLFKDTWPKILSGPASRKCQDKSKGTYHRTADLGTVDEIDLTRSYSGKELINILRARTFPPYPGAYIRDGDKKIYLRLELLPEDQREDT